MLSTKRSRFGQIGSSGSKRRWWFHNWYVTGAIAIGVPGWPEFAACTASIARQRIVSTHVCSKRSDSFIASLRGVGIVCRLRRLGRLRRRGAATEDDGVVIGRQGDQL